MNSRVWLALIASSIAISAAAFAQINDSHAADSEKAKAAILAARYAHGPKLIIPLTRRAASAEGGVLQPTEQQADSQEEGNSGDFVIFDAPGAVQSYGGTFPFAINVEAAITGSYTANSLGHGFLRAPDGAFLSIDVPGGADAQAVSINQRGEIAGYYLDANNAFHGFLRRCDGSFDTFNIPAGTFMSQQISINPAGAITGSYCDITGCTSFLRASDGTFTPFDVPGATDTFANSINRRGTVAGYDVIVTLQPIVSFAFHGFLRTADGTVTTFDVPGALGTFASGNSINRHGAIAGNYYDANYTSHGYVRAPDGTFEFFDVPGAGTGAFQGTALFAATINAAGTIAGTYTDANNVNHGFVRARNGRITVFDPPGSVGTFVEGINAKGEITGYYMDVNNIYHGFLRKTDEDE